MPRPRPGPGEALVNVHYCGICGSHLEALVYGMYESETIIGHKFAGEMAAVGGGGRAGRPVPESRMTMSCPAAGAGAVSRADLHSMSRCSLAGSRWMEAWPEALGCQCMGCIAFSRISVSVKELSPNR